jgi:hypothetical protein
MGTAKKETSVGDDLICYHLGITAGDVEQDFLKTALA